MLNVLAVALAAAASAQTQFGALDVPMGFGAFAIETTPIGETAALPAALELAPLGETRSLGLAVHGVPAAAEVEQPSAPSLAGLIDRMYEMKKLGEGDVVVLSAAVERAADQALNADLDLTDRLVALTGVAQVALLSSYGDYFEPWTHKVSAERRVHKAAEDQLQRLRFTLSRVRADSEKALATVYKHQWIPLTAESRAFMRDSLARNPFLR